MPTPRARAAVIASAAFAIALAPAFARAQSSARRAGPRREAAASHSESNGDHAPRRNAFVVNVGPMIGIIGTGFYARVNPEFQLHRDQHYGGHSFNIGASFVYWPNQFGPSAAVAPRWQYDQQLVPGTPFFVSPYIGMDVGLGVFNIANGGDPRFRFLAIPNAGIDVKLILGERFVLGFRPIGIQVPLSLGEEPLFSFDVIYDIAISLGSTY